MNRTIKLLFVVLAISLTSLVNAQDLDTLTNLSDTVELYAPQYSNPGEWGYILGQNSSYRQQFAEKYYIEGSGVVKGMVVHLSGNYNHPNNYVEFNVYNVAANALPGNRLGGKQVLYKDLDLSGKAMHVAFNTAIAVKDSFFVTFNVLDYLHGGYDGDTLGLMMGEEGSRSEQDLNSFGRNAVQAHNHTKEDWKDFYTQNFTPIATHFALYPIVEFNTITAIDPLVNNVDIKLFPNPAREHFCIASDTEIIQLEIYDLRGKLFYQVSKNGVKECVNTNDWPQGSYIVRAITQTDRIYMNKIIIK
ncbi:T9SS type A sorting domain-containing protein [Fulvivirga maritima]|uniref:T9SS type A sorting domain-containing protein n=1 Tax=Fulvivirga maritima TaxID=2904247 RepID=UPI001F4564EB|nr:T9SS type A sorting domain-containing protein [Fulvivirga maritima]UII26783.1 T9SS type A sorting domain-containing protein [Fulvivirga maritima]